MKSPRTVTASILQAATQIHDATDKLHELLPTIGAVPSRALLQAMVQARRCADDLRQLSADMDEDASGPVFEFDVRSLPIIRGFAL